jgi:hypothetical protein
VAKLHIDAACTRIRNYLEYSDFNLLPDLSQVIVDTQPSAFTVVFEIKNSEGFFRVANVVDNNPVEIVFGNSVDKCGYKGDFTAVFVTYAEIIANWDTVKRKVEEIVRAEIDKTEKGLEKHRHLCATFLEFINS